MYNYYLTDKYNGQTYKLTAGNIKEARKAVKKLIETNKIGHPYHDFLKILRMPKGHQIEDETYTEYSI